MNSLELIIDLTIFAIGMLVGMGVVAFVMRPTENNTVTTSTHSDADLIDYLDESECNLFFNTQVDGGSWGVLDGRNELVTAGKTVRQAVSGALMKSTLMTMITPDTEVAK